MLAKLSQLMHTFGACVCLAASLAPQIAAPAGIGRFSVLEAGSHLAQEVYYLNARLEYRLSEPVREALNSGVPITLEMEIEVYRPRAWIWDETVATLHQRYRLKFHALSDQYQVTNLNSNVRTNYHNLGLALRAVGTVSDLPLLDRRLLATNAPYRARIRTRLALEALPSPLRLWAALSSQWRIDSDWYSWPLQ